MSKRLATPEVVPFVAQMSDVDCGAACLTMSLRCLGATFVLREVSQAVGVGRDGVNAVDICEGARLLGFRARAVRVDIDVLHLLAKGSILHWEMRHFVVFERRTPDGGVIIVDPGSGRRRVSPSELDRALTGVAIVVERADAPVQGVPVTHPARAFWLRALRSAPELPRVLVASIALQVLVGLFPLLSAAVVDRVVPRSDTQMLFVLSLGLGWLAVFYALFTLVRGRLLYNLRTRLDLAGASGLLEHIASLPMPFFQERSPGDLLVRVRSNETLREALSSSMLASVLDGAIIVLYISVLIFIDPIITLVVLGLIAAQALSYGLMRRRHKELVAEAQHRQSVADGHLIDTLGGMENLKVSGSEGRAVSKWVSLYVDVLNVTLRRSRLTILADTISGTIRVGAPFLVLLVGTPAVLAGAHSLGTMLSALALAQGIVLSVGTFLSNLGELDALSALVDRLDDVFLTPPEQAVAQPPAPTLEGHLRLDAVGFRPTLRSPFLVRNVSIEIPAGAFVAFVGESGSGKSTIASLIAGLIDPTEGRVELDGKPLSSMDLRSVRRQMGVVVQRSQMFGSSVRDNITMLDDVPLEQIERAARLACIHDDITAMGMGYMTPLVAGGAIAGGQRQRIALARALLHRPRILILDEATSALDAITEHQIFANIREMGCTRVVVAHRLSTIMAADLILVMKGGELVERGTHDQLLALGGTYSALVAAQRSEVHQVAPELEPTGARNPS